MSCLSFDLIMLNRKRLIKFTVILPVAVATSIIILNYYKNDSLKSVSLERMVMPGLMSREHAKYESSCYECHLPFSKESQDGKCIACHKEVGKDLKENQGYHGLYNRVSELKCKSCHTEHKGREAILVILDKETFDHKHTDYVLAGAHADISASCEVCHETGKKYRDAKMICFDCHEKDDAHRGQLGQTCKECHNEISFSNASYDHDKTGFYPDGKHNEVECNLCHPDSGYKHTPKNCIDCHLINDIHDSKPDERCERCHSSADGWKKYAFDHDRETRFVLNNRHAELRCDKCHPKTIFKKRSGLECIDCHRDDDIHKGRTGPVCAKCHDSFEWRQARFNHDKDTSFQLLGGHRDAACISCHKDSSGGNKLEKTCIGCHSSDDVHQGQLGTSCNSCHNTREWGEQIRFEHDLTPFPLIGMHTATPCGECHLSSTFKENLRKDCISCHQQDDGHELKLGTNCARCHNPNGWRLWEFDHNSQAKFKLQGAHEGLKCQACHREPMKTDIEIPGTCYSCHKNQDVHLGKFGEHCDWCHNVNEFVTVKSFHKISKDGESERMEKNCFTCHRGDDIHYGSYGRLCDRCHTVETFFRSKIENY